MSPDLRGNEEISGNWRQVTLRAVGKAHPICTIVLRLIAGRLYCAGLVERSNIRDEAALTEAIVGVGVAAAVGGWTMGELKGSQLMSRAVKWNPAFLRSYNQ
ncbi:hypothetical protein D9M69_525820 [compost metagenome]